MARGYVIFGDIEGKLDVRRIECTRCDRAGRYTVTKLIEKHGRGESNEMDVRSSSRLSEDREPRASNRLWEMTDLVDMVEAFDAARKRAA